MGRSGAINAPLALAPATKAVVWYSSTTALKEGAAVCFNWDLATTPVPATAFSGRRFNEVENPTVLNAQHFAGVAACNYNAASGGQLIEIYLPGSVCNILCGVDTLIGVGLLTFDVTAAYIGQFRYAGIAGEGSVQPFQTTTFDTNPHKVMAKLQVGSPSGGVQVVQAVDDTPLAGLMIGGTTLIIGVNSVSGDIENTLADGTIPGLRKKFGVIDTDITSNDFVLTITNGVTDDIDDVVLASITWAASSALDQEVTLVWGPEWIVIGRTKTTPAFA